MNEAQILKAYEIAKERYAALGVDTDKAIESLEKQQISLHCWQTDDVVGFERGEALSGGIQATGNYPGRARNIDEVRSDLEFVKTLLAGKQVAFLAPTTILAEQHYETVAERLAPFRIKCACLTRFCTPKEIGRASCRERV